MSPLCPDAREKIAHDPREIKSAFTYSLCWRRVLRPSGDALLEAFAQKHCRIDNRSKDFPAFTVKNMTHLGPVLTGRLGPLFIPHAYDRGVISSTQRLDAEGRANTAILRADDYSPLNLTPEKLGSSYRPGVICKCGAPGLDNLCLTGASADSPPFEFYREPGAPPSAAATQQREFMNSLWQTPYYAAATGTNQNTEAAIENYLMAMGSPGF